MDKKFQVKVISGGFPYYLIRTTWTGIPSRGDEFPNETEAKNALIKARQFTKPALYKAAQIVESENPENLI